jgi:hypothetical protein
MWRGSCLDWPVLLSVGVEEDEEQCTCCRTGQRRAGCRKHDGVTSAHVAILRCSPLRGCGVAGVCGTGRHAFDDVDDDSRDHSRNWFGPLLFPIIVARRVGTGWPGSLPALTDHSRVSVASIAFAHRRPSRRGLSAASGCASHLDTHDELIVALASSLEHKHRGPRRHGCRRMNPHPSLARDDSRVER